MTNKEQLLAELRTLGYNHVALKIEATWGTKAFHGVIAELTLDTRENTRRGFKQEIFGLILDLTREHEMQFGYINERLVDQDSCFHRWD